MKPHELFIKINDGPYKGGYYPKPEHIGNTYMITNKYGLGGGYTMLVVAVDHPMFGPTFKILSCDSSRPKVGHHIKAYNNDIIEEL